MRRLALWLVVLAAVWGLYQFHDSGPRDPWDRINLQQIAVTFAVAVIIQTIFTRVWDVGTVGVLFTAIGTAVFYGCTSIWPEFSDHRSPEWLLDIARAAYTLGGPLFLIGLLIYGWNEWQRGRRPAYVNGLPERRNGEPGRRDQDYINAAIARRHGQDRGDY